MVPLVLFGIGLLRFTKSHVYVVQGFRHSQPQQPQFIPKTRGNAAQMFNFTILTLE
jgi:hypothetical protein